MNMAPNKRTSVNDGTFKVPGIESAAKERKEMFSLIGPTKQDLARGKGIPGAFTQFTVALRWRPLVNS